MTPKCITCKPSEQKWRVTRETFLGSCLPQIHITAARLGGGPALGAACVHSRCKIYVCVFSHKHTAILRWRQISTVRWSPSSHPIRENQTVRTWRGRFLMCGDVLPAPQDSALFQIQWADFCQVLVRVCTVVTPLSTWTPVCSQSPEVAKKRRMKLKLTDKSPKW